MLAALARREIAMKCGVILAEDRCSDKKAKAASGTRPLLEKGDDPLLGRLGRTVLAHVYGQYRMGRSVGWRGVGVCRLAFN